jgi:hypothetical protein
VLRVGSVVDVVENKCAGWRLKVAVVLIAVLEEVAVTTLMDHRRRIVVVFVLVLYGPKSEDDDVDDDKDAIHRLEDNTVEPGSCKKRAC